MAKLAIRNRDDIRRSDQLSGELVHIGNVGAGVGRVAAGTAQAVILQYAKELIQSIMWALMPWNTNP